MKTSRFEKNTLWVAMASCFAVGVASLPAQADIVNYDATHIFSMDDIQGGFDGSMYGATPGGTQDATIICGVLGGVFCPGDGEQPFTETKGDLLGTVMYPIDSEFGYYVQDYVGAAPKVRDGVYSEGWAGNVETIPAGEDPANYPVHPVYGTVVGLALSDQATARYKVTPPWGRWCTGAGGTSVKCETEHYVVMDNIRSCYETLPYFYANPYENTGDVAVDRFNAQGVLYDPNDYDWTNPDDPYATATPIGNCALGQLDNMLYEIVDGLLTDTELQTDPNNPFAPNLTANESTVRYNIAASTAYAMTKKDDGKPLYRFGNMDKKPNDIRFYARIPLPQEWKDNPGTAYQVTKAKLITRHLITNNPNDQMRAEDMENEGAIGRKPGYIPSGDKWLSAKECYEGDGDHIPSGTVLKNGYFAYTPANPDAVPPTLDTLPADLRSYGALPDDPSDDVNGVPYPYSSDLRGGFTAGWYTTTDREPFEWAYDTNGDGIVDVSTPVEDSTVVGDLLSGPRWRLRPNKFGQDLPGLEVPSINCMPTPYTSEFVKYPVLLPTVMEHDLLDYADLNANGIADDSPLLTSTGWIDHHQNFQNEEGEIADISVNGAPLTNDFDVVMYIKGDRKSVAVYNTRLEITYEGTGSVLTFDASLDSLEVPASHVVGTPITVSAWVTNLGPANASGSVAFDGYFNRRGATPTNCSVAFVGLAPNVPTLYSAECSIPNTESTLLRWEAELEAANDSDLSNNFITRGTYETVLTQP